MTGTRTPLYDEHTRLGANLIDFAGWSMPVRYTSDLAEHHAVRRTGGLFDLCHMGQIEVSGPGAGDALDHAVVSDISKVPVGAAKYTMICAPDGGVIDDLIVYHLAPERFLVVANAANAGVVTDELIARAAGFDARVEVSDAGLVALQGPVSTGVVQQLVGLDLAELGNYAVVETTLDGHPVRLARTGYTGEDGFEVFCAAGDTVAIWRALLTAGEPVGVVPCGLACRDSLRLEAGMPLYGHELTRQVTPYEAGLGRVVAVEKAADFVGRQALTERSQTGPRSRLVGLTPSGRRAARAGYPILDSAGEQVGQVTSGAPSPTLGHPIAMGFVPPELAEPGTVLAVSIRDKSASAEVVRLPFYRRSRG